MAFLSIIVPVYNVQSYVRECLLSVIDQDFEDFEIIVVDDCSPDHSGDIAEELAQGDARIRPLHLEHNVGLGHARNAGLAAASGEYVLFLDGDDTFAPGSLRAIAEKLRANDLPEVLIYNYSRVWWDGREAVSWGAEQLARLSVGTFAPRDHRRLFNLLPIACNKAYRRDFLVELGVGFQTGLYEDISFTYTVLLNATRAVTLNRVVLLYRQRRSGGNILGTPSPRHFDVFAQYDLVFAELDRRGVSDGLRKHLYDIMINHFVTIIRHRGRIAKSERRPFFAQATLAARRHFPASADDHARNLPSDVRGQLFRRGSYRAFAIYNWVDSRRAPVRRFVGSIYWPVRRTVRKVRAVGRLWYGFFRMLPIKDDLVVFSEYWGTGFGCNPRAIFEALPEAAPHLRAVWVIEKDQLGKLPAGVDHVAPNTLRQWAVFARAKYFVNNVNFPGAFVKRPGQVVIQTMHGTPLKHVGLDVMNHAVASTAIDPKRKAPRKGDQVVSLDPSRSRQEFADLLRRSDNWDFALSSNAYSTERWSHAYPCSYQWLEFGYPRNDVLVNAAAADIERSRALIGVRPGQTAVLYAPTYRDVEGDTSLRIDFDALIAHVPHDVVFILRAHHTTTLGPKVKELVASGRVIDGSAFPSIIDCYLAADVLITDYSSVMFDYAVLDRPIVIYADDWEAYQEARGTYFDLLASPPGAVATTQAQLNSIFEQRSYEAPESRARLARFRERFCAFDDGQAARRVITTVMVP
ncbi:MAG: bifunctional glycosyltransferase family 2 protein/CDP-glycerol:glycerophosphate glycerophosphotransferase [Candidatus Nanopelagicales bacterium]|nr:bifunctional glycosyltransferase family 2 protein/CDP-glycerol:glycerophosphate glycerophosphotransferase [Candidatus Nanopelagicales bacterium]